jgi:hypothetical protein
MTEGLNIRKISSPIFGASRIKRAGRENPDSRKKYFQKHFEDEKEKESDDGSPSHKERSHGSKQMKNESEGSESEKIQNPLSKELGRRVDIRV